jgi:protein-S-isoprenylcysteine O-methyltransferase Ste14
VLKESTLLPRARKGEAGTGVIVGSIWALLPVTLIMSPFVIRREEEYLARTVGEEYERYKIEVHRWV